MEIALAHKQEYVTPQDSRCIPTTNPKMVSAPAYKQDSTPMKKSSYTNNSLSATTIKRKLVHTNYQTKDGDSTSTQTRICHSTR